MRTRERSPELTESLDKTPERFARSPPWAAASVAPLGGTTVVLFPTTSRDGRKVHRRLLLAGSVVACMLAEKLQFVHVVDGLFESARVA